VAKCDAQKYWAGKKKSAWPEVRNAIEKLTSSLHEDFPDSFASKKTSNRQLPSFIFKSL